MILNTEQISSDARKALMKLDESFIGTQNYMGLEYFWSHEYRHYLRDSTSASRRKVHTKLLEAGLQVDTESDQHLKIVKKYHHIPKGKF